MRYRVELTNRYDGEKDIMHAWTRRGANNLMMTALSGRGYTRGECRDRWGDFLDNLRIRLANSEDLQTAVFLSMFLAALIVCLLVCGAE